MPNGDDAFNKVRGILPIQVLSHIVRYIVTDPDAVVINADERGELIELDLHVSPSDIGRVIGRQGRVASAIRTVVQAAALKEGVKVRVTISGD